MSSLLNSPAPEAQESITSLDIEKLIDEVQKRPTIWDKSCITYSDKVKRIKMWDEICTILIDNWSEYNATEKTLISTEVKKKWRNLKDAFAKELAILKGERLAKGSRKKRKYIHFEALSFLTSQLIRRQRSNDTNDETEEHDNNSSNIEARKRKYVRKKKRNNDTEEQVFDNDERDNETLENLRDRKAFDEDVSFCEMLIPMVKKLNDDQKHYARVEILNILNKARYFFVKSETSYFDPIASP